MSGISKLAAGRLMSAFLKEVAAGAECTSVSLGRLPGFPGATSDPKVVEKAIAVLTERADAMEVGLPQLKMRQRVRDLKWGAECLRATAGETEAMKWFIKSGAAWCEENGVEYGTLREMGVPAKLLKEAGVER